MELDCVTSGKCPLGPYQPSGWNWKHYGKSPGSSCLISSVHLGHTGRPSSWVPGTLSCSAAALARSGVQRDSQQRGCFGLAADKTKDVVAKLHSCGVFFSLAYFSPQRDLDNTSSHNQGSNKKNGVLYSSDQFVQVAVGLCRTGGFIEKYSK